MAEKGYYTVFKGYIDESYDQQFFVLACLFGKTGQWLWFTQDWEGVIKETNANLRAGGRKLLRRYHAVECSNRREDFEKWSEEEQIDLTKKLLKVFQKPSNSLYALTYAVDLQDMVKFIPETAKDAHGFAYSLLLKMLMIEIGKLFERPTKGDLSSTKITLIHDRCPHDSVLLQSFNAILEDKTFKYKNIFTTIASLGWEDCPPLQPTDLIAYEGFKEVQRRGIRPQHEMRKTLQHLLGDDGHFRIRGKGFNNTNLEEIKKLMDDATTSMLNAQADQGK